MLDEINRQLDIMKNGEFSDEDFEASKKAICDAYRSFNDTPDALDIYYGTQLTGDIVTPDEAIENFLAVTRDDVKKRLARSRSIPFICLRERIRRTALMNNVTEIKTKSSVRATTK